MADPNEDDDWVYDDETQWEIEVDEGDYEDVPDDEVEKGWTEL